MCTAWIRFVYLYYGGVVVIGLGLFLVDYYVFLCFLDGSGFFLKQQLWPPSTVFPCLSHKELNDISFNLFTVLTCSYRDERVHDVDVIGYLLKERFTFLRLLPIVGRHRRQWPLATFAPVTCFISLNSKRRNSYIEIHPMQ